MVVPVVQCSAASRILSQETNCGLMYQLEMLMLRRPEIFMKLRYVYFFLMAVYFYDLKGEHKFFSFNML